MRLTPAVVLLAFLTTAAIAAQEAAPPAAAAGAAGAPATQTAPGAPGAGRGGGRGGRGGAPRVIHVPDAPQLPYVAVEHPFTIPANVEMGVIASVAVNSKGHVFLYQRMQAALLEFDGQGRFVRSLREGTQTRAHSLRIDSADNMWLVDSADATVTKLSPQGDVLMTLGTKGVTGRGDEAASKSIFDVPADVAIAPNGDIFVSQGEGGAPDPRVIHFDAKGKFLNTWSLAVTEGTRSNPHAIEVDRNGLVYVGDREMMKIRIFRADGTPVRELQMPTQICGLYFDKQGHLWTATGFDGQLMQLNLDGSIVGFAGKAGTGAGEFGEAHTLAVAADGAVYVVDTVGKKVEKFVRR